MFNSKPKTYHSVLLESLACAVKDLHEQTARQEMAVAMVDMLNLRVARLQETIQVTPQDLLAAPWVRS